MVLIMDTFLVSILFDEGSLMYRLKKKSVFLLLTVSVAFSLLLAHPTTSHLVAKKSIDEHVSTGNASITYRFVPGWGELPDGKAIGPTHGGVAVDPQNGLVYVSTNSKYSVLVYRADGHLLKTMAPGCRGFHALDISVTDGQVMLYGAQLNGHGSRLCKLDSSGKLLMECSAETHPRLIGGWKGLTAVAVAPDGSIFCSMGYGSNKIHKFSPDGQHLMSFGGKGSGDNALTKTCHGLKVDTRFEPPRLLVCDRENRRLFHTTLDGDWIGEVATGLRRPCAVSIHGDICAVGELEGRVTLLDKNGEFITHLGDNGVKEQWANFKVKPEAIKEGVFTAPHGLCFDLEGNLYVQDWNISGRVSKLLRHK
jgi:hypothetical protein